MPYQTQQLNIIQKQHDESDCFTLDLKFIKHIFLIFILFLIASQYAFAEVSQCSPSIQKISFAKHNDPEFTERPKKNWTAIKDLPMRIDDHLPHYSGNIWYKLEWEHNCPSSSIEPIALMIEYMSMAGEVYSNNDLIWQDKSLTEPLSRSWNTPRYWHLPASSIQTGKNTLWIRIVAVPTQGSGIGKVKLGSRKTILPLYEDAQLYQRKLHFFNLIFSLAMGVIAGLVWIFHKKDQTFGWFALSSMTWVILILSILITEPIFNLKSLDIARLNIIALLGYSIFSCFYAWRLANRKFIKLERIMLCILVIMMMMAFIAPNTKIEAFLVANFFIAISILMLNFITYPYIAYKSKISESYLLASVFIIYLCVSLHDTLNIIFNPQARTTIAPFTAPIAMLFITIILAMRLSKNIKKIEGFNKILELKIIETKNELSNSLQTQHQLELQNTRLQERINLAHDLHDGLGSSLVRSIILIDESKQNITNQQFSSILKVLRNDLRQIIDSGSSSGAQVPASPKVWGAMIRYRFVQIFDEMNIKSVWAFPEQWDIQPTALECLALLRVLEETLTNVIKHSQASKVEVRLAFNTQHQLVLDIHDNGIGFDVDAVMQGGMSVGIRSIQLRLSSIQAQLSIHSTKSGTHIKVTKSFKVFE